MQKIQLGHNPFSVVMAYVLHHGRNDLIRLFVKYNIPAEPTPAEIIKAIKLRGIGFLHDFDKSIIRPYSKKMLEEMQVTSFDGAVTAAASNMASNQKNPNKGANILAGITGAVGALDQILGAVGTIRNNKNPNIPNVATNPINPVNDYPSISKEKEDDDKDTKKYLFIGGGVLLAVAMLFLFMNKK